MPWPPTSPPVAVARMVEIADRRLGARRGSFTALVADATQPPPRPPSDRLVDSGTAGGGTASDLALLVYLHLPRAQWRAALAAAVGATAPGGAVLVVAHALRNLTEGVGGPQDPSILLDPDDVVESAAGLPVEVELAELRTSRGSRFRAPGARHRRPVPPTCELIPPRV